jgi:hypothetical protein
LEEWLVFIFTWSALLIDLLAVPFLLWRRSRIFAYGILAVFHVLNSQLFSIGIFPWFMIFATLIFFDPSWPRFFKKFRGVKIPQTQISSLSKNQKIILSLVLIFIMFNVTVPLRHHAYPGYVSWTEEGHNFSWHMKLRDKDTVHMEFIATDPKTGRSWSVDHTEDLTERQAHKMSTRPDMILQYAHFLAEKFKKEGYVDIEIRAEVFSSLNERTPQRLIDNTVNLAAQPATILPKPWIMPLEKSD